MQKKHLSIISWKANDRFTLAEKNISNSLKVARLKLLGEGWNRVFFVNLGKFGCFKKSFTRILPFLNLGWDKKDLLC